jgi:hypothetical protein
MGMTGAYRDGVDYGAKITFIPLCDVSVASFCINIHRILVGKTYWTLNLNNEEGTEG